MSESTLSSKTNLQLDHVLQAAGRISSEIHRTPVMTSRSLDEELGIKVLVKCEQFQRVGAFKFRGASHAISCLSPDERSKGVVTHSSGNHAQALALAARRTGTAAYIVMPKNAPEVKRQAVAAYGAEIIPCENNLDARESTAAEVMDRTGATFIHPYDDARVIAGQGTAALELIQDYPETDLIVAPIGGGGLISGTCLASNASSKRVRVWGAEPTGADDAWQSKESGSLVPQRDPTTIADGLRTSLGDLTWPFVRDHVERIVRVSDEEIISSMRWMFERMKLVIEPSGASVIAALRNMRGDFGDAQQVGVIISGGNVDLAHLPWC